MVLQVENSIALVPMNESEYQIWSVKSKNNYRDEIIKNGFTFEEASLKAEQDMQRLLPDGIKSPDQYLFTIKLGTQWIGTLWFGVRGAVDNRKAFIYDIVLEDDVKGKGYGKRAMELLEVEVKKLGLRHIGLHVFGHNTVARNLYEKLGYLTTNVNMEKTL